MAEPQRVGVPDLSPEPAPGHRPADGPGLRHRPMATTDVDGVVAVEVGAYSHPWSRGNFIDALAAGYDTELRWAADGRLLGYWVAMPGVDELHLLNITVAPAHQRQGHGRALMHRLIAHARRRGDPLLWLEVRQGNQAAQALYRGLGFEAVGLRKGYYPALRGREDALVMRLDLSDAAGSATPPPDRPGPG